MPAFLAFDLGAESGRAMLGTLENGVLSLREASRFKNEPIRRRDSLRWDVDALWNGVTEGLSAAHASPVTSIGVDAWGCDFALVDRAGGLVDQPYHYRDKRTNGVMARVCDRVGRDRIYRTTGIQFLPFNTLYQLCAARHASPEMLDSAHRVLTMPDLINCRLTGLQSVEFTNATTTQCVDAATGSWAMDLIADLDLPAHLFGPIVQPGTVLGPLSHEASERLAGTPVVAPACHDTGSAVASVHAGGDTAFVSCGTWSLLGTEVAAPVITDRSRELNFTNEGGVDGTTRLLKNIGGLWLLQACRRSWANAGHAWSYTELIAAAADAGAFQAVIDPDDPAFLAPDDMVAAIADYCDRTGQSIPNGPAGYTRAILEGLALKYRVVLDALEEVTGTAFRTLRVIGGGTMNGLLMQFTADASGREVLAGPVEATALGNIAVQAVAMGVVPSLAAARTIIGRSFPQSRFEPLAPERWRAPLERLRENVKRELKRA